MVHTRYNFLHIYMKSRTDRQNNKKSVNLSFNFNNTSTSGYTILFKEMIRPVNNKSIPALTVTNEFKFINSMPVQNISYLIHLYLLLYIFRHFVKKKAYISSLR